MRKRAISTTMLTLVCVTLLGSLQTRAQGPQAPHSPTRQEMLDGLVGPKTKTDLGATRGLGIGAPRGISRETAPGTEKQKRFMDKFLRKNQSRSPALPGPQPLQKPNSASGKSASASPKSETTAEERQQLTGIINKNKLPTIDLVINFEYKSSTISPRSLRNLIKLGQVMKDPKLAGSTFLLAGHTDAKGGTRYNLNLSERRAMAVKEFLSNRVGINADTLVTVGYGKEQLMDRANPYAAKNRRVQIVNINSLK